MRSLSTIAVPSWVGHGSRCTRQHAPTKLSMIPWPLVEMIPEPRSMSEGDRVKPTKDPCDHPAIRDASFPKLCNCGTCPTCLRPCPCRSPPTGPIATGSRRTIQIPLCSRWCIASRSRFLRVQQQNATMSPPYCRTLADTAEQHTLRRRDSRWPIQIWIQFTTSPRILNFGGPP